MITRCIITIFFIIGLAGCQTHVNSVFPTYPSNNQKLILITFPAPEQTLILPNGSSRNYRGNNAWSAPLSLQNTITTIENRYSIQKQKLWFMDSLQIYCGVFSSTDSINIESLINSLRKERDIESVQVMNTFSVMYSNTMTNSFESYNDSDIKIQYGIHLEQLHQLHKLTKGHSVKVGIIDTLSDELHPDLCGQVKQQYKYVNEVSQNKLHGTAMAGIISAKANNNIGIAGLAPEAKLYLYGACENRGEKKARCNSFNILQSLEQAIKDKINIINLSIAGPHDTLVERVIRKAVEEGAIIIAAVNSEDPELNFPASLNEVIAVDSLAINTNPNEDNGNRFTDWILSEEKMSTLSGGGYQFFSGSSVSTASVSGFAALLRGQVGLKDTKNVLNQLVTNACLPSLNNINKEWEKIFFQSICSTSSIR